MSLISYLKTGVQYFTGLLGKPDYNPRKKEEKKNISMTAAPCEQHAVKLDGITAGRSRQSPSGSSAGAICLLTKRPHRSGIDCRGRSNAFARTFGATEGDPMPTPRVVLNSLEICCQGITPPHYSAHTNQRKINVDVVFIVFACFALILFLSDLTPIINELCN